MAVEVPALVGYEMLEREVRRCVAADGTIQHAEDLAAAWRMLHGALHEEEQGALRGVKRQLVDRGLVELMRQCVFNLDTGEREVWRWTFRCVARMGASSFETAGLLCPMSKETIKHFLNLKDEDFMPPGEASENKPDGESGKPGEATGAQGNGQQQGNVLLSVSATFSPQQEYIWSLALAMVNTSKCRVTREMLYRAGILQRVTQLLRGSNTIALVGAPTMITLVLFMVSWYDSPHLENEELVQAIAAVRAADFLDQPTFLSRLISVKAILLASRPEFDMEEFLMAEKSLKQTVVETFAEHIDHSVQNIPSDIETAAGPVRVFWSVYQFAYIVSRLACNPLVLPMLRNKKLIDGLSQAVFDMDHWEAGEQRETEISTCYAIWHMSFDPEIAAEFKKNTKLMARLEELAKREGKVREPASGALFELNKSSRCTKNDISKCESTKRHIMISYCWKDQELAHWLWKALEAHGFPVWIDVAAMTGSTLEAMAAAVEESAAVLVCLSQAYKDSAACRTEAEYAYSMRKEIVPIKGADYAADGWLGALIGTKLWYQFDLQSEDNLDQQLESLVKTMSAFDLSDHSGHGHGSHHGDKSSGKDVQSLQRAQAEAERVIVDLRRQLQQKETTSGNAERPASNVSQHEAEECQGWIHKQGGRVKTWRRRYMVFSSDGTLAYYASVTSPIPKGVLYLKRGQVEVLGPTQINWDTHVRVPRSYDRSMGVQVNVPGKQLLFFTETEEEAHMWVQRLRTAPSTNSSAAKSQGLLSLVASKKIEAAATASAAATWSAAAKAAPAAAAVDFAKMQETLLARLAGMQEHFDKRFTALEARMGSLETAVKKGSSKA